MKSYSVSQRKKSRGNMTWYGRTFENGVLVSEISLKTERKSDAKAWLDAMNASRFMPENMFRIPGTEKDMSVKDAVRSFMDSVSASNGPDSNTYRAYSYRIAHWARFCERNGVSTLVSFTRDIATRYVSETASTHAPKTMREMLRLLRQFFSWCAETYSIEGYDPMKTVKSPKLEKREKAFWTPVQIDAILDNAPDPYFRLFWALMAFAGLRHAEACSFGPSSIAGKEIRVIGKGNKEAFLPIGKRLEKEISEVKIYDGMFSTQRYRKSERCIDTLKKAVSEAGLPSDDATNHKFRHSFISNLLRSGVTVPATARLARHEDPKVTMETYSHLLQEDLQESIDVL